MFTWVLHLSIKGSLQNFVPFYVLKICGFLTFVVLIFCRFNYVAVQIFCVLWAMISANKVHYWRVICSPEPIFWKCFSIFFKPEVSRKYSKKLEKFFFFSKICPGQMYDYVQKGGKDSNCSKLQWTDEA